jgi:hypothetical protein
MSDNPGGPGYPFQPNVPGYGTGVNTAQMLQVMQELVQSTNTIAQLLQQGVGTAASGDINGRLPGPLTVVGLRGTAFSGVTGTGNAVLSASPTLTGTVLVAALTASGEVLVSHLDGITALAGGGRPGAPVLSAQMNRIAVVANDNDSAVLPAAVAGDLRAVINDGAHAAQIFGNGSDTIDGTAGATGVSMTNGTRGWFFCLTTGQWQSMSGSPV